ncbi:hypothetical protein DAPPUDRAFT_316228 [Daphnia pulex]|uniref:Uncharacterized protein n=1 Tax=Daphnia pulex TaxID=6669 RepID=E9GC82_DAPPU|nr:hypothetical protein DAPPUDRAFT_316228 [Daphnia pulex]|eukprot:EFX82907.1 hypothetical protein DAPPUDRAFT_316228 [Daphnia pulex]
MQQELVELAKDTLTDDVTLAPIDSNVDNYEGQRRVRGLNNPSNLREKFLRSINCGALVEHSLE